MEIIISRLVPVKCSTLSNNNNGCVGVRGSALGGDDRKQVTEALGRGS